MVTIRVHVCVVFRQLGSPVSKGPSSKLDELDAALGLAADRAADSKRVRAIDTYIHTYIDLYRSYISYFFQVLHIMIFCLYVCVYVFLYFCIYVCRSQWSIVDIGDEPIESCLS